MLRSARKCTMAGVFLLYTVDVTALMQHHGLDSHSSADDTQVSGHSKSALCAVLINRVTLYIYIYIYIYINKEN